MSDTDLGKSRSDVPQHPEQAQVAGPDAAGAGPAVGAAAGPAVGAAAGPAVGAAATEGPDPARCLPARTRYSASASTKVLLVALVILLALTVVGSCLTVGDHLAGASPVLAGVFYVALALVVAMGVVVPVVQVARRPVFSLYRLRDEQGHAKRGHCRMLVNNLLQNTEVTADDERFLLDALDQGDEADDILIGYFEEHVVPQMDAATRRSATTAFLATSISHSALVDTVTMLSISLDLVRSIVQACGFRPTNLALARIYSRVMLSALIAGGLDDADLDGLIGTILGGGTGARGAGIVLGSMTSGLVDAFLVFRVGVITKRWLCSETGPADMAKLRRRSYGEALELMRTSGFTAEVAGYVRKGASAAAGVVANSVKRASETAVSATANAVKTASAAVATSTVNAVKSASSAVAATTSNAMHQAAEATSERTQRAAFRLGRFLGHFRRPKHLEE